MASFQFPCCGEVIFLSEEHGHSVFVEHNCGGVPCKARAVSLSEAPAPVVPEGDIASPELDAALDLVPVAEPAVEEAVAAESVAAEHEIEQKSME